MNISSVEDIKNKLILDGDLRGGEFNLDGESYEPFEYREGDDLGFYQQATEFLLQMCLLLENVIKIDKKDQYEKGKLRGYNIAKGYKEDGNGNISPR